MAYIERDNVISELKNLPEQERLEYMGVYDCVKSVPTADVVEVRHGENITKMYPTEEFICSECGLIMRDFEEIRVDEENDDECYYEFEFKYCPHCGAKMEERTGNND